MRKKILVGKQLKECKSVDTSIRKGEFIIKQLNPLTVIN